MSSKIANFSAALLNHILSGNPKVSDEQYAERLSICETCEFCDKSTESWTCKACGCNLKEGTWLPGKARWASQICPYPGGSKWPKLALPVVNQGSCSSCPSK